MVTKAILDRYFGETIQRDHLETTFRVISTDPLTDTNGHQTNPRWTLDRPKMDTPWTFNGLPTKPQWTP